jgi:molecular chaperone DnaJ
MSFDGFDFSVVQDTATGAGAGTFSELFADVFQRSAGVGEERPTAGVDLHASVALSFEEAVRGTERTITFTRQETCGLCRGTGVVRTAEGQCLQCHGSGSLRWTRGHMVFSRACTACSGTGRHREYHCTGCAGRGLTARGEALSVHIPSGTGDGERLRVPGKGHAGRFGGPSGDLVVEVRVASHPLFQRQGEDLFLVLPVAVHEAALGAKIDVPTLDGPARLRVPPGTQTGQRFRLRDRGLPTRDGRLGDLVVEVRVVVPPLRDERSKELMREFAHLNPGNVRKELGV